MADLVAFYGPEMPVWAARIGGQVVGVAGFWQRQDRLYAFFDTKPEASFRAGTAILRALRQGLAEAGQDVYVECDARIAKAERLLSLLGFIPTPERTGNNMTVWVHHVGN